jgi:hypothetical protein
MLCPGLNITRDLCTGSASNFPFLPQSRWRGGDSLSPTGVERGRPTRSQCGGRGTCLYSELAVRELVAAGEGRDQL